MRNCNPWSIELNSWYLNPKNRNPFGNPAACTTFLVDTQRFMQYAEGISLPLSAIDSPLPKWRLRIICPMYRKPALHVFDIKVKWYQKHYVDQRMKTDRYSESKHENTYNSVEPYFQGTRGFTYGVSKWGSGSDSNRIIFPERILTRNNLIFSAANSAPKFGFGKFGNTKK